MHDEKCKEMHAWCNDFFIIKQIACGTADVDTANWVSVSDSCPCPLGRACFWRTALSPPCCHGVSAHQVIRNIGILQCWHDKMNYIIMSPNVFIAYQLKLLLQGVLGNGSDPLPSLLWGSVSRYQVETTVLLSKTASCFCANRQVIKCS